VRHPGIRTKEDGMSPPLVEPEAEAFRTACRQQGTAMERMMKSVCLSWQDRLLRLSLRMAGGDLPLAEDAVQIALTRVWRSCRLFATEALYGWIAAIVRNTTIDLVLDRKRQATERIELDDGEVRPEVERGALQLAQGAPDRPEEAAQREEGMALLVACMSRFESAHPVHALAIRCAMLEMDGREMAAALRRSEGATRELLRVARQKAAVYLAPWYALARIEPRPPAPSPAHPGATPGMGEHSSGQAA
jgi:RNA polymerase sigma factor (sigma-70 family)